MFNKVTYLPTEHLCVVTMQKRITDPQQQQVMGLCVAMGLGLYADMVSETLVFPAHGERWEDVEGMHVYAEYHERDKSAEEVEAAHNRIVAQVESHEIALVPLHRTIWEEDQSALDIALEVGHGLPLNPLMN